MTPDPQGTPGVEHWWAWKSRDGHVHLGQGVTRERMPYGTKREEPYGYIVPVRVLTDESLMVVDPRTHDVTPKPEPKPEGLGWTSTGIECEHGYDVCPMCDGDTIKFRADRRQEDGEE